MFVSTKSHPLLHAIRKQQETKVGPYVVVEKIGPNAYALDGLPAGVPATQNVSFLTPYVPTPDYFRLRPDYCLNLPQKEGDEWEWEIDEIINTTNPRRGQRRFLVKWTGYDKCQWLPMSELTHAVLSIREYYAATNSPIPEDVVDFLDAAAEAHLSEDEVYED